MCRGCGKVVKTFLFIISLLIVAQHFSGNHVPIIRSWRVRDVIALCWYLPWLLGGCQDFCIHYFSSNSCSTCFGQPCAHHQELTTAWCNCLVLVCAVAVPQSLCLSKKFIIALGQHVSILTESSSGPSKKIHPYLTMFKYGSNIF